MKEKQFFIKTTSVTKAKNALQKAIHELMDAHNQTLISEHGLYDWIRSRTNEIVMLNREHHRCSPEELQIWKSEGKNLGAKACDSYHLAIYEVKS